MKDPEIGTNHVINKRALLLGENGVVRPGSEVGLPGDKVDLLGNVVGHPGGMVGHFVDIVPDQDPHDLDMAGGDPPMISFMVAILKARQDKRILSKC